MKKIEFNLIIRQIIKRNLFTLISFGGLLVGYWVLIMTTSFVRFEYSYDSMHKSSDQIYRINSIVGKKDGILSVYATSDNGFGPALAEEFAEVKSYLRMWAFDTEKIISFNQDEINKKQFREKNVFFADSNFFSFFSYPLKTGRPNEVLKAPNSMVLSESAGKKYFGSESPIGKTMTIRNNRDSKEFTVTGVFYDLPANSNLQFDFLLSMETLRAGWPGIDNSWHYAVSYTYLLLADNTDPDRIARACTDIIKKRSTYQTSDNFTNTYELVPLREIHQNKSIQWELERKGNHQHSTYLIIIALGVIMIAWFNYINLNTSFVETRQKEIRTRKILGSSRGRLFLTFIVEAVILNLSAFIAGLLIAILSKGLFENFTGKEIPVLHTINIAIYLAFLFLGILISGLIPALIFTGSMSQKKGSSYNVGSLFSIKRMVITGQFLISISLIISTIIIYKQLNYLKKIDVGADIQNKIVLKTPSGTDFQSTGLNPFKERTKAIPGVRNVTATSDIPGQYLKMGWMIDRTDVDPQINEVIDGARIDYDFMDVFRLKLLAGKSFLPSENNSRNIIINETACSKLRYSSPNEAVGKQIILPEFGNSPAFTIYGVIKDFHLLSPEKEFSAFVLFCADNTYKGYNYYVIDIDKKNRKSIISSLKTNWEKLYPNSSFDYFFLSEFYDRQYVSNTQFGDLLSTLSFIAIFLSVLGLFGLINYAISKRIKEIGIRKINGAKIWELVSLFNKDIIKSVAIAFVIATPIAYYAMNQWLENFAYKTTLRWWIFALAGLLALGIALLTVSWQSWKAATRNPVEALRYE